MCVSLYSGHQLFFLPPFEKFHHLKLSWDRGPFEMFVFLPPLVLLSRGIDGAHGALNALPLSAFIQRLRACGDGGQLSAFPRANRCLRANNIPWPDVLGNVGVDKARFLWQNFQKIQCDTPKGG